MPDWQDAQVATESPVLAVAFNRFAEMAKRLAIAVTNPSGFVFDQSVQEFLAVVIELSGAAVASCRRFRFQQEAELFGEPVWAQGTGPVGDVARLKHQDDCRSNATRVEAWTRIEELNQHAQYRRKLDGTPYYSGNEHSGEMRHFHWVRSEAVIPLRMIDGKPTAMIVLGHPEEDFFDRGRVAILEQCCGLIDAFYGLATFAGDRIEKARLLEQVAGVMPLIASADTEVAFARAVCTLLTCSFGFRFDRALYFRMTSDAHPAECLMAVGGIDDGWPARRGPRAAKKSPHFRRVIRLISLFGMCYTIRSRRKTTGLTRIRCTLLRANRVILCCIGSRIHLTSIDS